MFTTTTEEELGFKREFKSWLSGRAVKKIKERRSIKQRLYHARTLIQKRQTQQEYTQKNVEIEKSARRHKRELADELAEEAETAAKQTDIKIPYSITRQLSDRRVNTNKQVHGSNGTFLSKTLDQLDEWKEYLSNLLNGTPIVNPR